MFIDFISGFITFLNTEGYAVSTEKAGTFLQMCSDEEIDITKENIVISLMQLCFCRSKNERDDLPSLFQRYLQEQKDLESREKEKKILEEQKADIEKQQRQRKEDLEKIRSKIRDEEQEAARSFESENEFNKKEQKFLETNRKRIQKDHVLSKYLLKNPSLDQKELRGKMKEMMTKAESSMVKGNKEDFQYYKTLFGLLKSVSEKQQKNRERYQKHILDATKESKEKEKDLLRTIQKEQSRYDQIQTKIQKEIIKPASITHRTEFKSGSSAVKTTMDLPAYADKDFKYLSKQECLSIEDYIREHLLAFKSKLTSYINTLYSQEFDVQKTILNACRTGGIPMDLFYKRKRPGRAKLMLVLDVSGSCKSASSMMLTFMHALQSVFPGGCSAFAFTNRLYDISGLMDCDDAQDAIDRVLGEIPRSGAYSNYEIPLRTLWDDHRPKITKDSIVIFMGDARNNKNDPAYDYFKNICRRAKRSYFLNTDNMEEWDHGDSIASGYAQYTKMFEVTNTRELLGFIEELS